MTKTYSRGTKSVKTGTRWLKRCLVVCCVLTSIVGDFGPALADDEPLFKSDIPKLDVVPKPSVLKGGVQHRVDPPPPKPMKSSASSNSANSGLSKFKLFGGGKAKSDQAKPMTANVRDNSLNAMAQSGVGIIGVKFVLAFGRPPVINRVFPGTPAWTVGVRNGDIIVAVDGVPTYGLTKEEVYGMIVGTPNTPVTVTIARNGDFLPRTMNRMDFNDITDPIVRRDYIMSM